MVCARLEGRLWVLTSPDGYVSCCYSYLLTCNSRKNIHIGNSSGGGRVLKKCKAMYEANLGLPHGRGVIKQIPSIVGVNISGTKQYRSWLFWQFTPVTKNYPLNFWNEAVPFPFHGADFLGPETNRKDNIIQKHWNKTTLTYEAGKGTLMHVVKDNNRTMSYPVCSIQFFSFLL